MDHRTGTSVDVDTEAVPSRSGGSVEIERLDALERLAFGLVAITSRAIQESTVRGELTVQQWRVLVVLGFAEDGLRVSELGGRIAASGPSTSRLVRRLERRGFVTSGADPRDGRALRIRLSDDGRRLRERIVQRRRSLIREAIVDVDGTAAGVVELTSVAEALASWI